MWGRGGGDCGEMQAPYVEVSGCRFMLGYVGLSQGPFGGVVRGARAPSTPSGLSWEVPGGNFGSVYVFSKNFANL